MARTRKLWRYRAGRHGHAVVVEEMPDSPNLYVRIWDPRKGDYRYRSLRHADRRLAVQQAEELALRRLKGEEAVRRQEITLRMLFAYYRRHRTPTKAASTQSADAARIGLWQNVLGADRAPETVSAGEIERFIERRRSGEIDARGNAVPKDERRSVGDRTMGADIRWLAGVFRWGQRWRLADGTYLVKENPIRGVPIPKEKNPRRPLATRDRYEALRAVSDQVMMTATGEGKREETRSSLSELLDIAVGTGRRISAVCQLEYRDLQLGAGPYGAIVWRAEADKTGRRTVVPIAQSVRAAIDRVLKERPGIGAAPLFPSPRDPAQSLRYELASDWLREAERLAKLKHLPGGCWHPYRRLWATERKGLPLVDVAAAGGWASPRMLMEVYMQPDEATLLAVVCGGAELREAGR
jgi:integrase